MKPGQAIRYIDESGASHTAYIEAVGGSGESGFKVLDVVLTDGRRFQSVNNQRDRVHGSACWVMDGPDVPEEVAPEPEPEPAAVAAEGGDDAAKEEAPAEKPEPRRRGRRKQGQ